MYFAASAVDVKVLWPAFSAHGDRALLVCTTPAALREARERRVGESSCLLLDDLIDEDTRRAAIEHSNTVLHHLREGRVPATASLLKAILLQDQGISRTLIRRVSESLFAVQRILKKCQPGRVVTTKDDVWLYRGINAIANDFGVDTVVQQHGVFVEDYLRGPLVARRYVVWSEESRRCLTEYWDASTTSIEMSPPTAQKAPNGAAWGDGSIIFATQPLKWRLRLLHALAIIRAFKKFPDVPFIVKVHPKENALLHYCLVRALRLTNTRVLSDGDIEPLLDRCRAVITVWSTVGEQALRMGKAVVVVRLAASIPTATFMHDAIKVTRPEDVTDALRTVLAATKSGSITMSATRNSD
jgi:hypothetical protein